MPTFKGKDGKPRFSMNPQVGKSMFGGAPGMEGMGDTSGKASADPNEDGDSVEVHHGGSPEGEPEMHEGTAYHTIHKDAMGAPTEIRNHDSIDEANAHVAECMGATSTNDGDSDDAPAESESAVFE